MLGAIDANSGALRWACKYERIHPTRGTKRSRSSNRYRSNPFANYAYAQAGSFRGFAPSDLYVIGDLVILGAVDSTVLLCLNGANGEVLWMHNAEGQDAVLTEQLSYIVGHNEEFLFVMSGTSRLLCIGLRSGLRYWDAKLPSHDTGDWRGRGVVTADYVVVPGSPDARQVHIISAKSKKLPTWQTLDLPSFSIGKQPLGGPVNVQVHDAYLAVCYEGGVELYSTPTALQNLASESATGSERGWLPRARGQARGGDRDSLQDLGPG